MKVENMLYIYIAICISMIFFNIVYCFALRWNEHRLERKTDRFDRLMLNEIDRIRSGLKVSAAHKRVLGRKLKSIAHLTAFDRSLEAAYIKDPGHVESYIMEICPIFIRLAEHYHGKDNIRRAYFPYIVRKYNLLQHEGTDAISHVMFELLYADSLYCRENALSAIYSTGNADHVVRALKIIDQNSYFHHPKLVCDGLLGFPGDKEALSVRLWDHFENYSIGMQLNILNFLRFAGIRCDERMLSLMTDERRNQELRFACIRYFEKFPIACARESLLDFAENQSGRTWEYQSIATSALKSYPGARSIEILKKNLSSSNWDVRRNAAISCEALGLAYSDLIAVFDGNDRYAREMLLYRFDRREAKKEAMRA